jgi:hypothetical protein
MPAFRWTVSDPTVPETVVLELNPSSGGAPSRAKNLTDQGTTAPDGRHIFYEGQDEVATDQWTGTVLTQAGYEQLDDLYNRRHQLLVTDHLGRQQWVYLKTLKWKPAWTPNHPWKHDYTIDIVHIDIPDD